MIAVNTRPMRTPISGLEKVDIMSLNIWDSLRGASASPMLVIPINRTPKPAIICPTCL